MKQSQDNGAGRLGSRPQARPALADDIGKGLQSVGLAQHRDAVLYVPGGYRAGEPAGLLVLFHGAGGNGLDQVEPFRDLADRTGIILLGPDSRGRTWDAILDDYGPDVEFVDSAIERVFSRLSVEPRRVAVGGFSDGASYALSLGLTNGDLFRRIVAFSPGFISPAAAADKPRFYVSHGTGDRVLPIDACSRRLVPALRRAGFEVLYREFDGGHFVPPDIAEDAFGWLLNGDAARGAR